MWYIGVLVHCGHLKKSCNERNNREEKIREQVNQKPLSCGRAERKEATRLSGYAAGSIGINSFT